MDSLSKIKVKPRQPAYRQIAKALRNQILSGELKPGTKLPSTEELGKLWKASYFTVHTALMSMVKEGLVERLHGAGTYVAEPKTGFTCAGVYFGEDIWRNEEAAFGRSVHSALQAEFNRLKKETMIFVDSRPSSQHHELLPSLAEAVRNREIQCLICPNSNSADVAVLAKLPIPTAFIGDFSNTPNRVGFDRNGFLRSSMTRLSEQGCRSVGLISNLYSEETKDFYGAFYEEAAAAHLLTRDEWVRKPSQRVHELANFGYAEFYKLWSMPTKPDGLIINPDTVARGVITAILEARIRIPEQLRVIFHRNAHVNLLCPFPATCGIADEVAVAEALIQLIDQQFKGKRNSPITLPFRFENAGPSLGFKETPPVSQPIDPLAAKLPSSK